MKKYLVLSLVLVAVHSLRGQSRYSIIIDEIMADPSPVAGLPEYEWIELKNISNTPINLQNWRIGDASGQSGPIPSVVLQPDSFLVICAAPALSSLSLLGQTASVSSFPSLDNDGDLIFLRSSTGRIIDAVNYSSAWYGNELKNQGGWSLEMIDTHYPCSNNNWKASISLKGGTPGKINSVDTIYPDIIPPQPQNAYTINDTTIIVVYTKAADSLDASLITNYSIDGSLIITRAITVPPLFDRVQLSTSTPLDTNKIHTIVIHRIIDCAGNINTGDSIKIGLPSGPIAGDVVINELMFNPRPNAFDYIEIFNSSNKIIDASHLSIANRNNNNAISSIKSVSTAPHYIFPGEYRLLTEDIDNLSLNYLVKYPLNVLRVSPLPSFPNQQGDAVLLNFQGEIVDEVKYNEAWHFKLLNSTEGVSLERIDPSGPSNDPVNWHSAASTAGYGTPGYQNSQYRKEETSSTTIEVTPVFSPDNDGYNDIATIRYKTDQPGYVANITIFDANGRIVKNLVRNALLGVTGYWNWDGLDDRNHQLPIGPYIILTEIFNLDGRKESLKKSIVLARRLK